MRVGLVVAGVLLVAGCGSSGQSADTVATTPPPMASAAPTTASAAPATTSDAPTTDAPVGFTCAQVGGVFVPHGTDGRGDCEPATQRAACHTAPADQDPNYIGELTMSPPFAQGTIDNPILIGMSSNADCWINPLAH
jgi:hypothetical protein